MMPQTTSQYKPTVKLVNVRTGDYRVSSSDGLTFYDVNVARPSCTCMAGAHGFRSCKAMQWCKHVAAAKIVARAAHDRAVAARQPHPVPVTGAAGLMKLYQ